MTPYYYIPLKLLLGVSSGALNNIKLFIASLLMRFNNTYIMVLISIFIHNYFSPKILFSIRDVIDVITIIFGFSSVLSVNQNIFLQVPT